MNFIGKNIPDCFSHNFLGVTDAAIVVESELKNDHLSLGAFIELHHTDGPDITTVFSSTNDTGFVTLLHTTQVIFFDEMITTSVKIQSNMIQIYALSRLLGYPAEVHITAPANENDWNNLLFNVWGSLQSGEDSFEALAQKVRRKLSLLANSQDVRIYSSLDQAMEWQNIITSKFSDADSKVREALTMSITTMAAIQAAQVRLSVLTERFTTSQNNLLELERMHTYTSNCNKYCEDICMSGLICRNCSKISFTTISSQCSTMVKESRNVRIPPFVDRRSTWWPVTACSLDNNQICYHEECPVGGNEDCYEQFVLTFDSLVPVYNWKIMEVDVQKYENCSIKLVNPVTPDTCCDNTSCLSLIPNVSCIMENAMCASAHENTTMRAQEIKEENNILSEKIQEARKNLSLLLTAAATTKALLEIHEERRDQLQVSLNKLRDSENQIEVDILNKSLEQLRNIPDSDLEHVFKITNITFTAVTKTNPEVLELDITYETNISSNTEQFEGSFMYNISLGFEQITDHLVVKLLLEICSNRHERQVTENDTKKKTG